MGDTKTCKYCGTMVYLGAAVVAFLVIGWIVTHKEGHTPGPQSAAFRAKGLCEQAVRKAASHPHSIDFSEFGSQPPTKMTSGGYRVRLDFEEKDAEGDAIAKDAICTVKDGKLLSFKKPKL